MHRRACCGHDAPRRRGPRLLRRLWAAGLAGAVLVNGGCVATGPLEWVENGFKVGPNYCRPPAPVAPAWIEAPDARVQARRLEDWWNVFQDPTLNSLIVTAYRQNLNLRAVGTRVLEARAQQAIAAGNIFPQTQEMTGSYSHVNLSRNQANNPANLNRALATLPGAEKAFSQIPPSQVPTSFFSDWTAGFNMSWELDFWGRFRRAVESANASLDASVENYDDALVTLLADVATNYVQYRVAQQRIKIARDNVRTQAKLVALAERQQKVGTLTSVDVEQLRTLLEQTRSTIPALQITLGQANDALCTLLGVPPRDLEAELGPGPDLESEPIPNTPAWVAAGIPADLIRQRPDVRSAERQVAAQSAQIGVAEADLYPSFFINGTLGWEAQDIAKLFESSSFFGTILPQFRWNILNYGRIANNVRLQDARTEELIALYQNKVLTAAREVQTALRGFLQSQAQAADLARSATAATAATKTEEKLYYDIKADVNRLFTLESSQVQQQDNLAVAQGNIALNLINVYRALGGGWELRNQRELCGAAPSPAVPGPVPAPAPPAAEPAPAPQAVEPAPAPGPVRSARVQVFLDDGPGAPARGGNTP
jgi:NodT family efflux transporter outer membrane factor (OMF) lipoprotein